MKSHQIAESIWFSLAHWLLPLLAFFLFAIPGLILGTFLKAHGVAGAENYGRTIALLGIPAAFFVKMVLYAMKSDQRLSFVDGCREVFYSWLLYLHFVPVIGAILARWAEKRKARINPFVAGNEES